MDDNDSTDPESGYYEFIWNNLEKLKCDEFTAEEEEELQQPPPPQQRQDQQQPLSDPLGLSMLEVTAV